MSAHINLIDTPLPDIQRVHQLTESSIEMMTIIHSALYTIANHPNSNKNGIELKAIASSALIEVELKATLAEVRNG